METENGKTKVVKKGMEDEIRNGFDYELSLALSIDITHFAEVSKNRTTLFQDNILFKITPDTGRALLEWANTGKEVEYNPPKEETKDPVSAPLLEKLKAKADLDTINKVCGLSLKKIENITQTEALNCLGKLMSNK